MKQQMRMVMISFLLTACWTMAAGYKMPVTFSGYTGRSETLTNFPVLVVLSNNVGNSGLDFASQPFLSTNGWDLRFRDTADTTNLNYEIESWNTNGPCYVWVQVPLLPADGTGSILVKWGDESAQLPCTTNRSTWNNGFQLVQHMADTNASTSVRDSSTSNRTGVVDGTGPSVSWQQAGQIGPAVKLNNASTYIKMGASKVLLNGGAYTLSSWFKGLKPSSSWRTLVREETGGHPIIGNNGNSRVGLYSGAFRDSGYDLNPPAGEWHHIAAVGPPSLTETRFYVDGRYVGTVSGYKLVGDVYAIGNYQGLAQLWSDYLDEFRVDSVARSTNWIWACFMSQGSNLVFTSYGTAVSDSPGSPRIVNVDAFNVTTNSAELVGNLTTGDAPVTVTCYWGTSDGGPSVASWMTNTPLGIVAAGTQVTNSVTGLDAGRRYFFRYAAANTLGTNWAAGTTSFVTLGPPVVDNGGGPLNTGRTSATLRGQLLAGNPVTNAWIYWGTSDQGMNKALWDRPPVATTNPPLLAPFTVNVAGLTQGQTYWYICYASNSYGEAWSTSTNFTTSPLNFDISAGNDRSLNGGANLVADNATETIVPTGSAPFLYDWDNKDGYGNAAANNLIMGSRKITTSDSTSIALSLGGGSITGDSPSVAFSTFIGIAKGGSISIFGASTLALGSIDTHCDSAQGGGGGAVTLGTSGSPIAGPVRIDSIYADVRGYGTGNSPSAGGTVTIYGTGDVKIQTAAGTPGNIDLHSYNAAGGSVNIQHHGSFVASNIDTRAHVSGNWTSENSGSATFNGAFGGTAAGSFLVNSVNTTHQTYSGSAGAISIQGYTSVVAASLLASNDTSGVGGNISVGGVTAITGDIVINGPIIASGTTKGSLFLQAGNSITLTNLDLSKVQYARLQAGDVTWLKGLLTGTNGVAAAGLGNIGTSLRVPAGKVARYWHAANPALNRQTLILANESGVAGTGGTLSPWPAGGTMILLR
jgi:hypothetical protein